MEKESNKKEEKLSYGNVLFEVVNRIKVELFLFAIGYATILVGSAVYGIDILRELKYPLLFILTIVLVVYTFLEYIKIIKSKGIGETSETEESDKIEEAENLRNALAFENAKSVNTFISYRNFIETYPEAREVDEARRMFDKLLYEEKTADGTLESYEEFIRYFPSSPYVNDAKEMVFAIQTSANDVQSYIGFLHRYPESHLRKRAIDHIYHIYKENNRAEDFRYEKIEIDDVLDMRNFLMDFDGDFSRLFGQEKRR